MDSFIRYERKGEPLVSREIFLRRLGRKVVGGRPTLLRETERFHSAGPALLNKRIVIDPGHGGGDTGVRVRDGRLRWTESDIGYDLASRLADSLDTRVKVQLGKQKGKVLIEFASVQDLNRIISILRPEDPGVLR